MADRKIVFRSGPRIDELSPYSDRARVGGVTSAASLDLEAANLGIIRFMIGGSTEVTIQSNGRLDTTSSSLAAALRIGSVSGDPGTSYLGDGDLWYDSAAGKFRARQAGVSVDVIGGGGSGGGWQDDGTVVRLVTISDTVAVGTTTMLGSEKLRVTGEVLADAVGQVYIASGSGVAQYRVVYKTSPLNNEVAAAAASGLATCNGTIGVAASTAIGGAQVQVNTSGVVSVKASALVMVAAGDMVYLSTTPNGEVTNVEPTVSTQVKFCLGTAQTATSSPGGVFQMNWAPRMPMLIP